MLDEFQELFEFELRQIQGLNLGIDVLVMNTALTINAENRAQRRAAARSEMQQAAGRAQTHVA